MKTSKIIFSMVFIAGALMSMTSTAQTRVTINAGIIAPYGYPPNNGYVYYGPQQPAYYPPCGYYAPRSHYRQSCGYQHHAYNHPQYGNGNRQGNHNGNRNGNRNHPHHY
jgi:hypothetical protein